MFAIYKKEIKSFFNTVEGYVAIIVFFITTSIILWYIPSDYNIIYNHQASLSPFFFITPWVFLFLMPAITMKMLSTETSQKTILILLTKPIKKWEFIPLLCGNSKYFSRFHTHTHLVYPPLGALQSMGWEVPLG